MASVTVSAQYRIQKVTWVGGEIVVDRRCWGQATIFISILLKSSVGQFLRPVPPAAPNADDGVDAKLRALANHLRGNVGAATSLAVHALSCSERDRRGWWYPESFPARQNSADFFQREFERFLRQISPSKPSGIPITFASVLQGWQPWVAARNNGVQARGASPHSPVADTNATNVRHRESRRFGR